MTQLQHQIKPQSSPRAGDHKDWNFSREALIWVEDYPVGVNLHPFATEMRSWLMQEGKFQVYTRADKDEPHAITNPYTYDASALAALLAQTINAAHAFARSAELLDPVEAEIGRIRLYNEQVLYSTRFLEATTKQLLYCTQVPRSHYEHAALGALLARECRDCRSAGRPRHKISLLGSLAHKYHLCIEFEGCLFEHIKLVNRRRNVESAHASSQSLNIRLAAESRAELDADVVAIGTELVHMLRHLSDLELHMLKDMDAEVRRRHRAAIH
jgi:hypothetical protein